MGYHQDRFEDYSLMVYKKEKLIAVLPANASDKRVFSHQGLTYGGLLFSDMLKLKDVSVCLKLVLQYFQSNGFAYLHLKQLPTIYSPIPNDELQYLMFVLDAKLLGRETFSVLKLDNKPKLSKDRVAGKKRAIKQNLVVKEEKDLAAFWNNILIPNLAEKHQAKPVHSLEEITYLKTKFPNNIRQFNVYLEDVLVAGTTIFETKQVAHSQYISANVDKNLIGSLDFLHIHLIEKVFKDKMYFDFGTSNTNQGRNINAGLQYWKEGFGARTITQDFYEIDLSSANKLDALFI
ncbi:hypothetical protein DFR65_10913 [Oceanihabitans sediminis]|nr:GNAT family N-acetyltransferase [Oceanihabitans sediminis]RBP27627.1 hypothetical protein DFR65_10913 [Oceanihabitans sediminis]